MRKFLIFFLLVTGLFLEGRVVLAQNPSASPMGADGFNFQKAYQDYEYNLSLYDRAYNDYTLARSQYLQFMTITAKDEAKTKTFSLLSARDEVVKTHLTAVRMKVKETEGIADVDKEATYKRIDDEFKWFSEHKNKLSSSGSLEDLVKDSEEAAGRFELTKLVIYSSLNTIAVGKTSFLRAQLKKGTSDLKAKIAEIRQNQDKDVTAIERSLPDIENKFTRSRDKEIEATNIVNSIKNTERNKQPLFTKSQTSIEGAFLYLKEANILLLEIMRQIKTNG